MHKRLFLSLLLVVALAAACGDDDGTVEAASTTAGPDTPVSSPAGSTDDGATDTTWARIEPTDDLVNPVVATPDSIVADPDDPNAVLVRFYGGVQECNGARTTIVEQGPDQVVIRLEVGGRADAGDTACIEIAEAQELKVSLDAPVAARELVAATA